MPHMFSLPTGSLNAVLLDAKNMQTEINLFLCTLVNKKNEASQRTSHYTHQQKGTYGV